MAPLTREQAEKILSDHLAPWVLALGMTVEALAPDIATLRIPSSPALSRSGDAICPHALTSGADAAMIVAVASAIGGYKRLTTVDLTINYTGAVARGDALLEARVVRLGRSIAFCTADIKESGTGKPVAFATGTYAMPKTEGAE